MSDWVCTNGHRCAPDEGVCMLCGADPAPTYETVASQHHAGMPVELRTSYPGLVAVMVQMFGAVEEQRSPRGKLLRSARPASVRVLMSLPVALDTSDPTRLRANALTLLDAADALEAVSSPALVELPDLICEELDVLVAEQVASETPVAATALEAAVHDGDRPGAVGHRQHTSEQVFE